MNEFKEGLQSLQKQNVYIKVEITADGGHRQAVKTMDCGSIMRGFESHCPPHF